MDNLAECSVLTQESLLEALQTRFYDHKIYTDLGEILVAVNPFQQLPIYGNDLAAAYSSSARPVQLASQEPEEDQQPAGNCHQPHVFKLANQLFADLGSHQQPQTCIISGESGSGKTETCKLIVQQLTYINSLLCKGSHHRAGDIAAKLLQMNPLMEAFGNAKTTLNNNSSRFGKYIELWTDQENGGRLCGASVSHYLLEKSRVTQQCPGEHNYHIFYFILAGLPHDVIRRFNIHTASQHHYLRSNPDCQDHVSSPACREGFNQLVESMVQLGMHKNVQMDIFRLVGAILLLGNLDFGDGEIAFCNPVSTKAIEAARALAVEPTLLCKALNAMTTAMKGEVFSSSYSTAKAQDCRDAAARAIYGRLFDHVLSVVNTNLATVFSGEYKDTSNIGILDLFGFENCEVNSFEQLCINLANEQIQSLFNKKVFHTEQVEMAKEGLGTVCVSYEDNSEVIELIMGKPVSLLSLLDEQSVFPKATDVTCLERFQDRFSSHQRFSLCITSALEFSVVHFAGKVTYNVRGFLEKNRDTLAQDVIDLFRESRFSLLRSLFLNNEALAKQRHDVAHKAISSANQPPQSARRFRPSFRRQTYQVQRKPSNPLARKASTRKNKVTVGGQFRLSLKLLISTLAVAEPHFVRCIKPNQAKKPSCFDSNLVGRQIKQTGLVETVRIRKEGFSYRPTFAEFMQAYQAIAFPYTAKVATSLRSCFAILNKAALTSWHLGRTRVFLKYYHEDQMRQCLSDHHQWAILLQSHWRRIMAQKQLARLQTRANREKRDVRDFCNWILATSESTLCTCNALAIEDEARHRAVQQQLSEPLLLPTVPVVNVRKKPRKEKQSAKHTSSVLAWDDGQVGSRRRWPSFKREKTKTSVVTAPAAPLNISASAAAAGGDDDVFASDTMRRSRSEPMGLLHRASFRRASVRRASFLKPKQESQATEVLVEWRKNELARHSGQFETKWGVMFSAWFHGLIPRARAEELVSCKPNGTFLIRISEKRFGYTCTVLWSGSPRNFFIEQLPGSGRYRVIGSMITYPDLSDFVDYHSCHPLSEHGELLLHPCGEKARVTKSEATRRGFAGVGGYQGGRGRRQTNQGITCGMAPAVAPGYRRRRYQVQQPKPKRRRKTLVDRLLFWRA